MDASRCEEKSTKAATKGVNTKTKEPKGISSLAGGSDLTRIYADSLDTIEKKEKRAPTAYNTFTSTHMKALKETNPGKQNSELVRLPLLRRPAYMLIISLDERRTHLTRTSASVSHDCDSLGRSAVARLAREPEAWTSSEAAQTQGKKDREGH